MYFFLYFLQDIILHILVCGFPSAMSYASELVYGRQKANHEYVDIRPMMRTIYR
jgi:hypothetical protein